MSPLAHHPRTSPSCSPRLSSGFAFEPRYVLATSGKWSWPPAATPPRSSPLEGRHAHLRAIPAEDYAMLPFVKLAAVPPYSEKNSSRVLSDTDPTLLADTALHLGGIPAEGYPGHTPGDPGKIRTGSCAALQTYLRLCRRFLSAPDIHNLAVLTRKPHSIGNAAAES